MSTNKGVTAENLPAQINQDAAMQPAGAKPSVLPYDPYKRVEPRADFGQGDRSDNVVPEYLELEMMKVYTMLYLGIMPEYPYLDKNTGEIKTMEVACFMDAERNRFLNGATDLVKTVRQFPGEIEVDFMWTKNKVTKNGGQLRKFKVQVIEGSW